MYVIYFVFFGSCFRLFCFVKLFGVYEGEVFLEIFFIFYVVFEVDSNIEFRIFCCNVDDKDFFGVIG